MRLDPFKRLFVLRDTLAMYIKRLFGDVNTMAGHEDDFVVLEVTSAFSAAAHRCIVGICLLNLHREDVPSNRTSPLLCTLALRSSIRSTGVS